MNAFLEGLYPSLDLVSRWITAELALGLCHAPYRDLLARGARPGEIAARDGVDEDKLRALLASLEREGLVELDGDIARLSEAGRRLCEYTGWLTLFVGGYAPLFRNVDGILRGSYRGPLRDGRLVGVGSCMISEHLSIPVTRRLMAQIRPTAKFIVDSGCGNAQYLVSFCERYPELRAVGVDQSEEACAEARRLIAAKGLEDRVSVLCGDILDYDGADVPDFVIFAFILHEIVGRVGEAGLVDFLDSLRRRYPDTDLIVIEVDDQTSTNPDVFRTPMGRGYYNYYFLIHALTHQRLLPDARWRELFDQAGFALLSHKVIDPSLDPSGLEVYYALRPRR